MYLSNSEKRMLDELGFEFNGESVVEKTASTSTDMMYAGFGRYITLDNHIFEKQGEELTEIDSPEILAERRFLETLKK